MPFFHNYLPIEIAKIIPREILSHKNREIKYRRKSSTNKLTNILACVHPPQPLKIFFEGRGGCSQTSTILAHETGEILLEDT